MKNKDLLSMRYFLCILFVCIMAFAAVYNGPAFSQRHMGYCDHADSTAAALKCVNRHNQDVQEKLSEIFKSVLESQDENTRILLNEAQKNWIIYRDSQCNWESSLPEVMSLKRVYELSCLTALTEHRLKLLEAVQAREAAKEPWEFGTQARWVNALAGDYPHIFWRYGHSQSVDFDCDGRNEQVMTGIAVAHIQDTVTINENEVHEGSHQQVDLVVAVSDNPQTGRPRAKLFRVPVTGNKDVTPRLCRPSARLEPVTRSPAMPDSPENEQQAEKAKEEKAQDFCAHALRVTDRICDPLAIYWDGNTYVLEEQDLNMVGKTGEAL